MADYYPILVQTVSRLANNTAEARQEVYEHARMIVSAQMRKQDTRKSALETIHEIAALETAIARVEAESPSGRSSRAPQPAAAATGDDLHIGLRRERLTAQGKVASTPAQRWKIDAGKHRLKQAPSEMGGIPGSIGAMLIGTTYIVAMMAFIGVIYIRGVVLVSQNVIGYPILLVVITIMLCVFIFLPLARFRDGRITSGFEFLVGLTYSAIRRGF